MSLGKESEMSGQGFVIHEKNIEKKNDPAIYLVLGMALLAPIILFGTGFGGTPYWYGMVLAAIVAGLLPVRDNGSRRVVNYGLLGVSILYFTLFYKMSSAGFLKVVNDIIAYYNWKSGKESLYYVMPEGVDSVMAYSVFVCFVILILGVIDKQLLMDRKGKWFFAIQAIGVCFCLGCKQGQTGLELVCFCMAIIASFMWMNAGGFESRRAIVICLLGSFVICGGVSIYYLQKGDYKESDFAKAVKKQAVNQAEDAVYGKMDSPKGDLQKAAAFEGEEINRLKISASEPGLYHLKGYVGGSYEGGVWNPIDQESYSQKYEGMFRYFGEHDFHPLWQNSQYLNLIEGENADQKKVELTVENLQASRRYVYVPYGMNQASVDGFSSVNRDMNIYGSGDETNLASFTVDNYDLEKAFALVNPDWMNTATAAEEVTDFRDAQLEYRSFVHDNYLEVSDEYRQYFDQHIDTKGINGYVTITNYIRDWLKQEPNDSGKNTNDYLMFFLDRVRQGNSSFYSSAGVLLYRYMGIPARYVEGYLVEVTEDDYVQRQKDYEHIATGKNSHAWVEIYKDGIGWIPVEVTPGFYDDLKSVEQMQMQTQQTDVQEEPEEIEEETTYRSVHYEILLYILVGLGICIVLTIVGIILRRVIICKKRQQSLQHTDLTVRMNALMKFISQLLSFQEQDEDYIEEDMMEILLHYRFSQGTMEMEDYNKLLTYSNAMQSSLYEMLGKGKRMRMKYIACLK